MLAHGAQWLKERSRFGGRREDTGGSALRRARSQFWIAARRFRSNFAGCGVAMVVLRFEPNLMDDAQLKRRTQILPAGSFEKANPNGRGATGAAGTWTVSWPRCSFALRSQFGLRVRLKKRTQRRDGCLAVGNNLRFGTLSVAFCGAGLYSVVKDRSQMFPARRKGRDPDYLEDARRRTALSWLESTAKRVATGCPWHLR